MNIRVCINYIILLYYSLLTYIKCQIYNKRNIPFIRSSRFYFTNYVYIYIYEYQYENRRLFVLAKIKKKKKDYTISL